MKKDKRELRKAESRKMEQIQRKKRTQKMIVIAVFGIIVILSLVIVTSMPGNTDLNDQIKNSDKAAPSDVISQTEISIPLSEIGPNAKFYSYDSNGIEIRYFTVLGPDGNVHVAFDACDVCYDAKKGYRQNGDVCYDAKKGYRQNGGVMQCINCDKVFSINSIGTDNTAGGCWPSFLPTNIDGENIIIKISDLEANRHMF